MRLGGWQKTTLLDFPGRVACLVFTQGCNFTCPYCHNPQLVRGLAGERAPTPETVLAALHRRDLPALTAAVESDIRDGILRSGREVLAEGAS